MSLIADSALPSRVKTAAKNWGLTTIDQLRQAHTEGVTAKWRGIGEGTLVKITQFLAPPVKITKNAVIRQRRTTERDRARPLFEQIEDQGKQVAIIALRSMLAKDVTAARRWYLLAEQVRLADERRMG